MRMTKCIIGFNNIMVNRVRVKQTKQNKTKQKPKLLSLEDFKGMDTIFCFNTHIYNFHYLLHL